VSYFIFTTLFIAALALAVRPFLVRRAATWPAETPDLRDDVARAVSGLRDLDFARAAGTIAADDHDRLRALLERSAFPRSRAVPGSAAPWRTVAIAAFVAGVVAILVAVSLPREAGDRAPGEPITGTVPAGPTLTDLERRAKAAPSDVPAQLALGGAYVDAGRLPDAATAYQTVLALDKDNVAALNGLAIVLYRSGETRGAGLALDRVLSLRPKDPDALFFKGLLQYQTQDWKGAVATWSVFLDVGEFDPRASMVRGLYEDARAKAGS